MLYRILIVTQSDTFPTRFCRRASPNPSAAGLQGGPWGHLQQLVAADSWHILQRLSSEDLAAPCWVWNKASVFEFLPITVYPDVFCNPLLRDRHYSCFFHCLQRKSFCSGPHSSCWEKCFCDWHRYSQSTKYNYLQLGVICVHYSFDFLPHLMGAV